MALSVSCSYLLIDVEELPLAQRPGLCKQVSKQCSSMVLFKSRLQVPALILYLGFTQRLTGVTCEPPQVVLVVVCFVLFSSWQ